MALARITNDVFQALHEELQKEYVQDGEGYRLKVEPVDGLELTNATALRTTLQTARADNANLERQLQGYRDEEGNYLDPQKANDALGKVSQMANWQPEEKFQEQLQAREAALQTKHETELQARDERLNRQTELLRRRAVDDAIEEAIAEHGGDRLFLRSLVRDTTRTVVNDDESFTVEVLQNGQPRISEQPNNTGSMTVSELVGLWKTDKAYAGAFSASETAGSGESGKGSNRTNGSPVDMNLSAEERMKAYRQTQG